MVAELVEANLRFVVKVAVLYEGMGLPLANLIGQENMGMVTAERLSIKIICGLVGAARDFGSPCRPEPDRAAVHQRRRWSITELKAARNL